ncbi:hypothetical protein [Nostoc sp. TCL240-02]|uniref:hypothetical protein n=1 Tax=Nostoc sp. TCL240-02 TaxID=2572090 RepID=UPI00157FB945|nr:hypothetical protein [Nostoc sp. TCL240-02]QKQ76453.1 hypothetical protein FBB35_26995 [Nostoc sp. TCL240-02]
MAIKFELARLTSRVVRGEVGTRIIRGMEQGITRNGSTGNGVLDFIGYVFNAAWSLTGFLFGKVTQYFKFSWSSFWGWFVATKQFIWNFNWNATDEQLDASIKSQWTALMAQLGGALGNAFGYAVCGILPAAAIMVFNEPLGAVVLEKVSEEALEEILQNMSALFNSALRLGTQIFLTETYKNARKFIKSQSKLVKKLLGANTEKVVRAWGSAGSQPWSFAIANEQLLDNVFGAEGALREFTEEFQEEADEACVEAGYVVANAVDTFLSTAMLEREKTPVLGHERYVEITPNRQNPDEKIVLGGSEELLKPQIIQYLSTHEQFNGRDLGTIYGTLPTEMPDRRHRPEVVLKFYRKQNRISSKGEIVDALSMQIAFRLMNKNKEDFATDDYLKTLTERIHAKFATPPLKISKGTQTYTYADHEKGYQFKLDVISQQEARRIVEQVLDIQGHSVNDDLLRVGSKRTNATSSRPDKVTVRGKILEVPTVHKSGIVTFTHAYLNVGINVPPINLIDITGKKKNVVFNSR